MLPVLARKAIGAGGKVMARKIMGRKEKVNPNQQKPQESNAIVRAEKIVGDSVKPVSALVKPPEPLKQTSSGTVSKDSPLKAIRIKVLEIESILVGTLAAEKAELKAKKDEFRNQNRQKQEDKLEKKDLDPKKKMKMPKVPGTGGIFGWIKNFIGNILMGLFLMKLVDNAGMFKGLMNLIKGVSGFIADVGIKLIDGFATFVDWGYKAYDATKGFLQNFGVDPKLFDKFAGAISGLIDALIIASVILAARGDDKDGLDGPNKRGRPRRKPGVTTGRGGKKPRFRIPGTGPKVTRGGGRPLPGAPVTQGRGGKKPGIRLPGTAPKVSGTKPGIGLPKLPGTGPKVSGTSGVGPKVTGTFGGSKVTGTSGVGSKVTGTSGGPKVTGTFGGASEITGTKTGGSRVTGVGSKVTGTSGVGSKITGTKTGGIRLPKIPGTGPKVTGTSGGIKLPKLPGIASKVTGASGVISKAVKGFSPKVVMRFLRPIFKRIPVVGALIDFVVSLALGESVGRAAAKSVGATLGGALGTLIPIPGVGTIAGGILGDLVGGAIYDAVTKGVPEEPTGLTPKEAKAAGAPTSFADQSGGLGSFQEGGEVNKPRKKNKRKNKITRTIGGRRKRPTIKRLIQKPSPEQLPETPTPTDRFDNETKLKSKQRAWWDFLGWAGTGEVDKTTEYLTEKITNVGNTLGKDDYFGPLLRATSKVILNQDITPKDVKNVGLGINYLLNTGLEKKKIISATRAYAKGGVVDNALGLDVSSWVEDSFKKTIKTDISDIDILFSRRFTKSMTDTDTSTSDTSTSDTTNVSKRISTSTSNAVFGTTAQRRLLDTISWAEGTGKGYGVVYGGGISPELAEGKMTISQVLKFMETSPLYKRDSYNSDATGRYQFMSYVLKEEAEKQGIPFDTLWTPELQDKMILSRLATVRGVTAEMIEKEGMSDNIIDRLAPEFASFPNLIGPDEKGRVGTNTSYYGQGGKSAQAIKKYYGETTGEGTAIKLQEPSSPASAASPESLRPVETSSQTQPSGRVSPSKQNQSGKTPVSPVSSTSSASSQSSDSKDKSKGKSKEKLSGEEIAGKLGDFMKANRSDIGVTGSIHQWLPRHPPKFTRGYASYHNENRALDIGGWSPSSPEGGGADEQAPVIAALLKWNKENGFNPIELIHGSPAFKGVGSYRKYPDSHHHHVHVAYGKGGMTLDGPHLALIGEKGKEIVIDNDSSVAEVTPMLLAINAAKDKQGVMEAIRAYAPYDSRAEQVLIIDDSDEEMEVEDTPPMSMSMGSLGETSYDNSMDFLDYQG